MLWRRMRMHLGIPMYCLTCVSPPKHANPDQPEYYEVVLLQDCVTACLDRMQDAYIYVCQCGSA